MNVHDIPDFFQDESKSALRSRAKWMDEHLGLNSQFLSRVLGDSEIKIKQWNDGGADLPPTSEDVLRELWHLILHLLSYYNNDEDRVRQLLEQSVQSKSGQPSSPLLPPWFSASLKSFLEVRGADGIQAVNEWMMSIRFGDPYFTNAKTASCP